MVEELFIFCAYTGLAFIDLVDLRMEHIQKDKEGTLWIKNKRMKTRNEFIVSLLPIPIKILNKYRNHPPRQNADKVLPSISNQNYNAYLKEMAIRCKIKKNLTSHIARHTFATTVALDNSVPMEIISKMLNHIWGNDCVF